jgi:UDP-2,4-diacetamido-2,4,6-trideoxy-beta-L-altropyranose hydrolase
VNPGTLLIRADANVAMGSGHIMRCLALGQAWQEFGGQVVFASAEWTPAIVRRLEEGGVGFRTIESVCASAADARELIGLAGECCAEWIAIDGYQFDSEYQFAIKRSGARLLCIDDIGKCSPYCANVVLNQNLYASARMYANRDRGTALLLGTEYLLLRREFAAWQRSKEHHAVIAKHVLVTMGGSDAHNVTAQVVNALSVAELDVEITVVMGGSNPNQESLPNPRSECRSKISVQTDVRNMAELMAGVDFAISAAGTTAYELAAVGVPMVLVILAENQVPTCQAFVERAAAVDASWQSSFEPSRFTDMARTVIADRQLRQSLAANACELVDANGARRVCQSLLRIQAGQQDNVVAACTG